MRIDLQEFGGRYLIVFSPDDYSGHRQQEVADTKEEAVEKIFGMLVEWYCLTENLFPQEQIQKKIQDRIAEFFDEQDGPDQVMVVKRKK